MDTDGESTEALREQWQAHQEQWRAQREQRDAITRAARQGVELTPLPWEQYPGVNLRYQPPNPSWFPVHVLSYPYDWRLAVALKEGLFYGRSWRYHRVEFDRVISELARWQGDPDSEPHGFFHCYDGRSEETPR